MQQADLIIRNAGQLVTCSSGGKPKRGAEMLDVGVIADASVAVADGVIVGVGATREIDEGFEPDNVIDARGRVVCPGLVDPHTHVVFAGDRFGEFEQKIKGADYLEILASGGGILSTVRQTRAATLEQLVRETRPRLDKMLACGTTTCEIKTGYGLETATELKMLEAIEVLDQIHAIDIVPTFLAAHAVPPEFSDSSDGYIELVCEDMLAGAWEWYRRSHFPAKGTPFFVDVFTEKNAFDLDQSRRMLTKASEIGFALKAHVDEFTNLGGSRMGVEMAATSIDHLDTIDDEEIALLAGSDSIGVVTPVVNFNFGSPNFADARKLIDAGCAIAISTDYNPGSAPSPSQPLAMAIACRYQKLLPSEALNGATINAAFAIGVGEKTGSVEVGKIADLLILNSHDYRELMYEVGGPLQAMVIKGGRVVYDGSLEYEHGSKPNK